MSTSPLTPKIEKSTIVYQGYYNVQVDILSLPNTDPLPYTSLLAAAEAAVVLAETEDGRLIINKEYRHPSGLWLYSLPGGRVDHEELPLLTAQRELREETGFEAMSWDYLGSAFPLPAVCGQKIHYFLAKSARFVSAPQKEPLELIETLEIQQQELEKAIRAGAPTDGILLTALSFRHLINAIEK